MRLATARNYQRNSNRLLRLAVLVATSFALLGGATAPLSATGSPWVLEESLPIVNLDDLAIDVSGDTMIVGSGNRSTTCCGPGYADIRRWDGSSWVHEAHLDATTFAGGDFSFGIAVAIGDGLALVGAPTIGTVYVYEFDGSAWHEQARLVGAGSSSGDGFGQSIDLAGNQVVVSAAGDAAAYVFELRRGRWVEVAVLGAAADAVWFGVPVATSGDVIAVGGFSAAQDQSAVYVFEPSGRLWHQSAVLISPDADHTLGFGAALAASSKTVVVGSNGSSIQEIPGEAYVYEPGRNGWVLVATLASPLAVGLDFFGESVAIDGKTIAVAAPGSFVGAFVFTFRQVGGTWVHEQSIPTYFHCCAALSGDVIAVALISFPQVDVYRHQAP